MSADNAMPSSTRPALSKKIPASASSARESAVSQESFRLKFCERFGCADGDYEKLAFSKLLFPHARLVAPLARLVFPQFFDEDLKFIEYLGHCTGSRDLAVELQEFKDTNRTRGGVIRMNFYIRVSGRKAKRLFRELRNQENLNAASLPKPVIIP